jgi:Coenzyme PQQ synthesis protein D (PqqD).
MQYHISEDIIVRNLGDGEFSIINARAGKVLFLNETAFNIFSSMDGKTFEEIILGLSLKYNISANFIIDDVKQTIQDFVKNGIAE